MEEFSNEFDGWLPTLEEVPLPPLAGVVLAEVDRRKGATVGRGKKVLPVPWFDGLAKKTEHS